MVSRSSNFFLIFVFCVITPAFAQSAPLFSSLTSAAAESNLYRSQVLSGATSFEAGGPGPFEIFFQNEKRDFGAVLLDETTIGAAMAYKIGDKQYGEVRLMHTPGAVFLPVDRASVEHHLVNGLWDTMIVVRGAQYASPSHLIPGFSIGQRRDFEGFFLEARIHAAQDEGWHSGVETLVGAKLTPEISVRTSFTAGEEIVDPGVFNRMHAVASSIEWRRAKGLMLQAGYITLWGERRFETGLFGGGGWSW